MNISEFTDRLHTALISRGLSEEEASDCIDRIVPCLDPCAIDLDSETFDAAVNQCVEIIENKKKSATVPSFGDAVADTPVTDSDAATDAGTVNSAPAFGDALTDTPATDSDATSDAGTVSSAPAFGDAIADAPAADSDDATDAGTAVADPAASEIKTVGTSDSPFVAIGGIGKSSASLRSAPPGAPAKATAPDSVITAAAPAPSAQNDAPADGGAPSENKESKDTGSSKKISLSSKGRAIFIAVTALTSPLWALTFLVLFLPFIILFVLEAALISALIATVAAVSAAGTAASLTGIVYGIIRMFSVASEGLYEIGFGVIVAGVTMIVGILLFNAAVRFMPWLFRKTAVFAKFLIRFAVSVFDTYKRRFEKL